MTEAGKDVLEQLIDVAHEAVLLVNLDHPDWPVLLANAAYVQIGGAAAASWMFLLVIVAISIVMVRLRARAGRVE